jgi:hypothetical protein
MARPPFSMLRAAFWLLAVVVVTELAMTVTAVVGCFWLIVVTGRLPLGSCSRIGDQIREVWAEVLAAILALLLASKNGGPPPPDKPSTEGP